MSKNCFDIGTIQAFIDSELPSDTSEKVVKHVAACDDCALLLAETEEENAFAFSAMDAEMNPLVPTERLRTKVFASIQEIKSERERGLWNRLVGALGLSGGFGFAKPGLVAFASLALFVSGFAYIFNFYGVDDAPEVVKTKESADEEISPSANVVVASSDSSDSIENPVVDEEESEPPFFTKADAQPIRETRPPARTERKPRVRKAIYIPSAKTKRRKPVTNASSNSFEEEATLYGEESYIQTITTLDRNVAQRKDFVLRPRERVQFERNMALVDTAIKRMKRAVRKDPKNKAAREILKASYQNKIDLLNSVSDKDELVAGL